MSFPFLNTLTVEGMSTWNGGTVFTRQKVHADRTLCPVHVVVVVVGAVVVVVVVVAKVLPPLEGVTSTRVKQWN